MKGAAEPTEAELAFQAFHLARQRQVHRLVDARLQPERRTCALLEALLPLAHGRHEDRAHAGGLALGERAIELLQRLARPEHLLEAVERDTHARIGKKLVDDDGPGPDGGAEKANHDQLHDPSRLPEQRPDGEVPTRRGELYTFHALTSS
jgi:hypothetical protein